MQSSPCLGGELSAGSASTALFCVISAPRQPRNSTRETAAPLPKPIPIPRNRLSIRFSRSGGPGGQNVNKVSTQVEIRFRLDAADWIPEAVRARLRSQQRRRVNRQGELVVVSSRTREQRRNLEDCLAKLSMWIEAARKVPTKRKQTRPTQASRERRRAQKRRQSELKKQRSRPSDDN